MMWSDGFEARENAGWLSVVDDYPPYDARQLFQRVH